MHSKPYYLISAEEQVFEVEQCKILKITYGTEPFFIQAIKQERIFADKILAAGFYYQRNMLFDTAKHLYDLAIIVFSQGDILTLAELSDRMADLNKILIQLNEDLEDVGN